MIKTEDPMYNYKNNRENHRKRITNIRIYTVMMIFKFYYFLKQTQAQANSEPNTELNS